MTTTILPYLASVLLSGVLGTWKDTPKESPVEEKIRELKEALTDKTKTNKDIDDALKKVGERAAKDEKSGGVLKEKEKYDKMLDELIKAQKARKAGKPVKVEVPPTPAEKKKGAKPQQKDLRDDLSSKDLRKLKQKLRKAYNAKKDALCKQNPFSYNSFVPYHGGSRDQLVSANDQVSTLVDMDESIAALQKLSDSILSKGGQTQAGLLEPRRPVQTGGKTNMVLPLTRICTDSKNPVNEEFKGVLDPDSVKLLIDKPDGYKVEFSEGGNKNVDTIEIIVTNLGNGSRDALITIPPVQVNAEDASKVTLTPLDKILSTEEAKAVTSYQEGMNRSVIQDIVVGEGVFRNEKAGPKVKYGTVQFRSWKHLEKMDEETVLIKAKTTYMESLKEQGLSETRAERQSTAMAKFITAYGKKTEEKVTGDKGDPDLSEAFATSTTDMKFN